jgi:hypothetical protein
MGPPWLPAATVTGTFALTTLQMAVCRGSTVGEPQAAAELPEAVRLRFATSITPAFAVTQSSPQMSWATVPDPPELNTRTEWILAPGATPTTPMALSLAPIVPAT